MQDSEEFKIKYKKVENDENITGITDAIGITIVRNYNEDTEYFKDGKQMFIKLYMRGEFMAGGIEMVEKKKDDTYTIFHDREKYKNKFTGFYFNEEENITINEKNGGVIINRGGKKSYFSLNELIDLLVKNHLSDRLFWIGKKNFLIKKVLSILFLLMDSKYSYIDYEEEVRDGRANGVKDEIKIGTEPFFKYFKVYKNMLFLLSIFSLIILIYIEQANYINSIELSISNPILLFSFIIALFLLHFISEYLHLKKINKSSFIYKLHSKSLNTSFKLKIK